MKPVVKVRQTVDKTALLRQLMERLTDQDVYIGVPPENDARPDMDIGNAALSYLHEYGVPSKNIPARPHLFPVIRSMRGFVIKKLERAFELALQGDSAAVYKVLEGIGEAGKNKLRACFLRNSWRGLSEETKTRRDLKNARGLADSQKRAIAARITKEAQQQGKRGRQIVQEIRGVMDYQPLHDTGRLMLAHDYVIRKRKGRGGVLTETLREGGGDAGGSGDA